MIITAVPDTFASINSGVFFSSNNGSYAFSQDIASLHHFSPEEKLFHRIF